MRVGIDASNLNGGTLINLINIISNFKIEESTIKYVIVFSSSSKLKLFPDKPWLIKSDQKYLNKNFIFKIFWKFWFLNFKIKEHCDLLYLPGANFSFFHPNVIAFQNQLPFAKMELKNYTIFSKTRIRMFLLKFINSLSIKSTNGIIFLTLASKNQLLKNYSFKIPNFKVIPHGINHSNFVFNNNNINDSYKLIYVSTIDAYKHQDNLIYAIINLHKRGYNISLELVGDIFDIKSKKNMDLALKSYNKTQDFIHYHGKLSIDEIHNLYMSSNIGILASSCETFSIILLEMMSMGLPIACSNIDVLKETLGDSGVYFDPYSIDSIEKTIEGMLNSKEKLINLSNSAYSRSKNYNWSLCSQSTFSFLEKTYHNYYH